MVEGAGRRSDGSVRAESMRLRSSVRMDKAVGNRPREVPEPECISGLLWESQIAACVPCPHPTDCWSPYYPRGALGQPRSSTVLCASCT